ncbi:MAG: SpoIIE family protein phosphatase [Bacteroidales bacterium]|nr:SpoIIE family protein phosphatase [Bacteroidales bacterium]
MKYRSVQYGVVFISVLCILILVITMLFYYGVQQKQNQEISRLSLEQRNMMINNVLNIKRKQFEAIVHVNSAWDDFRERIVTHNMDEDWLYDNIGSMPETSSGVGVAVFDSLGRAFYHNNIEGYEDVDFFKDIKITSLLKNAKKNIFFSYINDTLYEYFCEGVVHSDDVNIRQEMHVGYLIMLRKVGYDLLREYSEIMGGINIGVVQSEADAKKIVQNSKGTFSLIVPLNNHFQNPIAYMYFLSPNTVAEQFSTVLPVLYVMAGVVLLTFLFVLIYTRHYIIRPLVSLVRIFDTEDLKTIKNLKKYKTEFGVLAFYIEKFFSQKHKMEQLYSDLEGKQKELIQQHDVLLQQKKEIENQIENARVLNLQIIERNKETEKQNVRISVQNEQLKEMTNTLKENQSSLESLRHNLEFNSLALEKANKEMLDSQNYATRLRNVLMVADTPAKHILPEYFVFQMFREKVGGDFVFAKKIDKWIITGVGDCNMSGIPGALLSALDVYLLNEVMDLSKISELRPDIILNSLNKKILATMGEEYLTDVNRDGLHISLFMYNTENYKAYFAASKRTIFVIHKGELEEYFGDNLSVGKITDDKQFRNVEVNITEGDIVYMYSNGCTDIIGGPFCKKLTVNNFKNQILKKYSYPMLSQKTDFKHFFEDWVADLEQTDDVTLFAYKIM